jgi:hypothetical protein
MNKEAKHYAEKMAAGAIHMIMTKTTITGPSDKAAEMFKKLPSIDPGDHKTPSVTDMAKSKDTKGSKHVKAD